MKHGHCKRFHPPVQILVADGSHYYYNTEMKDEKTVTGGRTVSYRNIPLSAEEYSSAKLDVEWALDIISEYSSDEGDTAVDIERMAKYVRNWTKPENLSDVMGAPETETERIGQMWLSGGGKRWRPILTAAVFSTIGGTPEKIRKAALAVECFHKASLIHDDIEDDDSRRYGQPTVHVRHGIPAAINAGDYLIGEGYRLLACSGFKPDACIEMVKAASAGHRELCLGQGEELSFCSRPQAVTEREVLRIYRRKTSAAFEVALLVGAAAAGLDNDTCKALSKFSAAIGTAYQIQDDVEDFCSEPGRAADMLALRPTIFLALACTSDNPEVQNSLKAAWQYNNRTKRTALIKAIENAGLHKRVELLYSRYKLEAEHILAGINHPELQRLLRSVLNRMLQI
ncbi:MAG: polyprenyl synthetase family protein [Kiritimatiellia bacterium]